MNVLVFSIHNNENDRFQSRNEMLEFLKNSLAGNSIDSVYESSVQPQFKVRIPLVTVFSRIMVLWLVFFRVSIKRYGLSWCFKTNLLWLLVKDLSKLLMKKSRSKQSTSAYRNSAVTEKHLFAWRQFLESNSDYLLVFESDVVIEKYSADRFDELFSKVEALCLDSGTSNAIYIDLAGGQNLYSVQGVLPFVVNDIGRIYSYGFVNTACAYLINKECAEYLVLESIVSPWSRFAAIDTLMNLALLKSGNQGVRVIHPEKLIFSHGSLNGQFKSYLSEEM